MGFFYYFYFILFLNSSCVNLLMGLESWKWPLGDGVCGQRAGGGGGLWSHVRSRHPKSRPVTGMPCCHARLSLSPLSLDAHRDLWHTRPFLQPLRCHLASGCNWAACAWLQLLAARGAPDGAFLGRVGSGPAPIFFWGVPLPMSSPSCTGAPASFSRALKARGPGPCWRPCVLRAGTPAQHGLCSLGCCPPAAPV